MRFPGGVTADFGGAHVGRLCNAPSEFQWIAIASNLCSEGPQPLAQLVGCSGGWHGSNRLDGRWMSRINVAVVGVGNVASSLVQGCHRYRDELSATPGVSSHSLAGYSLADIDFVCGFDVSAKKVGLDLAEAIFAAPNNFPSRWPVELLGARVFTGPVLDSLTESVRYEVPVVTGSQRIDQPEQIAAILRESQAEIVISFLPSGSPKASLYYAEAALLADCAFINANPDPIANNPSTVARYEKSGLPLLGDDLESQSGSTVMHRAILEALKSKGARILGSYQLNVGGNMDFKNLVGRGESKLASKRRGLMVGPEDEDIHVVPAVAMYSFLGDRKIGHILVEAESWLGETNQI